MRTIATTKESDVEFGRTAEDRAAIRRLKNKLLEPEVERSELETGQLLVEVRTILEPTGRYGAFLETLASLFTLRTAYRRIKLYERACEIWPLQVIDAAIIRKLRIVGSTAEKPMGHYENISVPKNVNTAAKADGFLTAAELEVMKSSGQKSESLDVYDRLKRCFRAVSPQMRGLTDKERDQFLDDLVGMLLTVGNDAKPRKFEPTQVPAEFWGGRGSAFKTEATRQKMRESVAKRWERIKA